MPHGQARPTDRFLRPCVTSDMKVRTVGTITLLLIASAAFAGPPANGLRLAVTVDANGAAAEFRIQNAGRRRVTFVKEYSCSGLSSFSISMGITADALDRNYGYEPRVKGLSREQQTVCTRNGPTKFVAVAPGKTVTVVVPFADKGEILASKETAFQANAALQIKGRGKLLVLHSAVVSRPSSTP